MTASVSVRHQKIRKNHTKKRLFFFLLLTALLMFVVIFAEQICPYDPNAQVFTTLEPPSAAHPAGTDRLGRDLLSRILVGLQTSVVSTLTLVVIITAAGTAAGVVCGHLGGVVDSLMMRVSDVCLAFPGLVFALAIAALLNGGLQNAIIALAVISWPKYARIARSQTLAHSAPYPAQQCGTYSCNCYAGHRHNDDGIGRIELPWIGRDAPHRGTGQYDERRAKHASDVSMGHHRAGDRHFCGGGHF